MPFGTRLSFTAWTLWNNKKCESWHLGTPIELGQTRRSCPDDPEGNNEHPLFKPISFLSLLLQDND